MTDPTPVTFRSDMDVELVKHSAADADLVWAARVSTQGADSLDDTDQAEVERIAHEHERLIEFLMKNRHGSPFEHATMTFYVSAPLFVFREFQRHRIASYNEASGRYKEMEPVFYTPAPDRALRQVGKPGHYTYVEGTAYQQRIVVDEVQAATRAAWESYQCMLDGGVAKEVARIVLPLNLYSSMFVTINARSLMNFLSLRTKHEGSTYPSYPQREIEMVAEQMEPLWAGLMPITHGLFRKHGSVCP